MASQLRVDEIIASTGSSVAIGTAGGSVTLAGDFTVDTSKGLNVGTGATIFSPSSNVLTLGTNSAERVRIDSSGDVGIGTDNPTQKLEVQTTGTGTSPGDNTAILVQSQASGRDCNIRFGDGVNATARIGYLNPELYFYVNGAERVRIDQSGNVGIGTDNPGFKLHLKQSSQTFPGGLSIERSDNTNKFGIAIDGNTALNFGYNDSTRAILDSTGNLTLTQPNTAFTSQSSSTNDYVRMYAGSGTGKWDIYGHTANLRFSDNDGAGNIQMDRPLVMNNQNIVMSSGNGIDFSATADGSGTTTSELLDDYEEGTWTPVINQGVISPTYTNTGGNYTKIGNCVLFTFRMQVASGTEEGSHLRIGGLPFTSNSSAREGGASWNYSDNIGNSITVEMHIALNSTLIRFYHSNGGNWNGNSGNGVVGETMHVHGQYFV